jgi:hypothetical protein
MSINNKMLSLVFYKVIKTASIAEKKKNHNPRFSAMLAAFITLFYCLNI